MNENEKKKNINTNSIDLIIQYFNYVIRCKLSNFFDREWFNYSYHTQAVYCVATYWRNDVNCRKRSWQVLNEFLLNVFKRFESRIKP